MSKKKEDLTNRTKNNSGPSNMTPLSTWSPGWVENIVDNFIEDGWILPENRMQEIAYIYKGNCQSLLRDLNRLREIIQRLSEPTGKDL